MNEALMRAMAEDVLAKLTAMMAYAIPLYCDIENTDEGLTLGLRIETRDGETYKFKFSMDRVEK